MSAFAAAVDVIFADPNLGLEARYLARGLGGGIPVQVIRRAPDQLAEFNGGRMVVGTVLIDVRVSQVAELSNRDRFVIGSVTYEVSGDPVRDAEGLVWKAQARAL